MINIKEFANAYTKNLCRIYKDCFSSLEIINAAKTFDYYIPEKTKKSIIKELNKYYNPLDYSNLYIKAAFAFAYENLIEI